MSDVQKYQLLVDQNQLVEHRRSCSIELPRVDCGKKEGRRRRTPGLELDGADSRHLFLLSPSFSPTALFLLFTTSVFQFLQCSSYIHFSLFRLYISPLLLPFCLHTIANTDFMKSESFRGIIDILFLYRGSGNLWFASAEGKII